MPLSLSSLLLLLLHFTTAATLSFSENGTLFPNCTTTFSCGSFTNITYPFICGTPDFQLACRDNHPELTTNSLTYRVLRINQPQQTLILARLDLWNQTCPKVFVNSTLNSTIFTPANGENENPTLFYGCNTSLMTLQPPNRFNCSISGVSSIDSYYLIGPVPTDPTLHIIECVDRVALPMLRTAADELLNAGTSLAEALMSGFSVNYIDPYHSECSKCTEAGGKCGFNSTSGQPICICIDRLCVPTGIRMFCRCLLPRT